MFFRQIRLETLDIPSPPVLGDGGYAAWLSGSFSGSDMIPFIFDFVPFLFLFDCAFAISDSVSCDLIRFDANRD